MLYNPNSPASVDYVNVKQCGAVGDNVADDTIAIQAAIDNATVSGKTIFLPAGIYKVTSGLIVDTNTRLVGEHFRTTKIHSTIASGNAVRPKTPTGFTDFVQLENITIYGDNAAGTVGIYMPSCRVWTVKHVELSGFGSKPLWLYGQRTPDGGLSPGDATYNLFEQVRFLGGVYACQLGGTTGNPDRVSSGTSNMNVFLRCRFASAASHGLFVEKGTSNVFSGCSFVANGGDGARVDWYSNYFFGIVSENNGTYGIRFGNYSEVHNNVVMGMHDGGSNLSGLIYDSTNKNTVIAYNRGLKLPLLTSPTNVLNNSLYVKESDGGLYFRDKNGIDQLIK